MAETTLSPRRYRNAAAMVDRLYASVGLDRRAPRPDNDVDLAYGEFTYGDGMVVVDEAMPAAFDRIKMPAETERSGTKKPNFVCKTADDLYRAASAAGATIVVDFDETDEGIRDVTVPRPDGDPSKRAAVPVFDGGR